MGFRRAPKSVTLNDLEMRTWLLFRFVLPNSVAGIHYVKMAESRPILSAKKSSPENLVFAVYMTYGNIHRGHRERKH